jgi:hypothetical protein
MKSLITWLFILCLMPFLTGCEDLGGNSLTGKLWSDMAANHNGPAPDPNLKISQTRDRKDFLVQYDEVRDRDSSAKRRAYWLFASKRRLEKGKKPHFVNPRQANGLQAVLVETNSVPDAVEDSAARPGAVLLSDHRHFTLVADGGEVGTFCLPVYADRTSRAELVALTPVTVLGDTAVVVGAVAAVVGLVYLSAWASNNDNVRF